MKRRTVAGAFVVLSLAGTGIMGAGTAGAAVGNPGPLTIEFNAYVDAPIYDFLTPVAPAPGTVTASGSLAFPAPGFVFEPIESIMYLPSVDEDNWVDVLVEPVMTQNLNGSVNPQTGAMALNGGMRFLVTSIGDHAGVLLDCPIAPVNIKLTDDEGFAYEESSGTAFLLNSPFGVPKVSTAAGCGGAAAVADMNEWLELPVLAEDSYFDADIALDPPPATNPPPTTTTVAPTTTTTVAPTTTTTTVAPGPTISVSDVTVTEVDTKSVKATFVVTLSAPATKRVTVKYATADGSAVKPADYAKKTGSVKFAPGETAKTVTVTVKGDRRGEVDETFSLDLSKPVNATIADGRGVGTITDNDPPDASIGDASAVEHDGSSTPMRFTVTLSKPAPAAVRIGFATQDGSATAPSDFAPKTGTVTVYKGRTTATISVTVKGGTIPEPNEVFTVRLSNPQGAALVDPIGIGTIVDND